MSRDGIGLGKPDGASFTSAHAGLTLLIAAVVLYVGREVFVPIAIALLLAFALGPIVSFFRRRSVPRVPSVLITVAIAFAVIAVIGLLFAMQVSSLANNIPGYQANVVEKVRSLREFGHAGGIIDRLSGAVERVGEEIERGVETESQDPLPVEIVSREGPIATLRNVVVPLIRPFATAGLVIVVVIFMLLERESLRDRFIRLVGYRDLHRTTEAIEDAGARVGRYLLMQLVVNVLYALPVAIGLMLIGVPNAALWGVMALVLRFVPYIGPVIAMIPPLFLSVAVSPGWSLLFWTLAMFAVLELIINNVIEPWLYGSQTGLSSIAIIIAAVFWTWLWGPLGLLLSTPLTVCLAVLGRHVPQFAFFDVLLGNEPVLAPEERFYQRLLAGDADEATEHAEAFLENDYLVDYYDQVGLPALVLAERDRERGALLDARQAQVAEAAIEVVENLKEIAEDESSEETPPVEEASHGTEATAEEVVFPDGSGKKLLCIGGRTNLDDAAAQMLAQVLEVEGAVAEPQQHQVLASRRLDPLELESRHAVVLLFLAATPAAHARQVVRRLKRRHPGLRVGILAPDATERTLDAETAGADFVATTMTQAVIGALQDAPAVRVRGVSARIGRRRALAPAG